jgi:hypothetical protein
MFVLLQTAKAQTFQTLAPQTNCSNGIFVDYIATGKLNANKTQLTTIGQFITSSDSVASISLYVEKSFILIEENKQFHKEPCSIKIYSASFNNDSKKIYLESGKQDGIFKISTNILTQKNNLSIGFNLPNIPTKEIEFVLVCEVVFKNGCRYIKKQKIALQ